MEMSDDFVTARDGTLSHKRSSVSPGRINVFHKQLKNPTFVIIDH
jgi:hypothetical protein